MEQSEVEKTVTDLEMRVDRLRSLYDQYFMGIERIPPSVSHKDVERRIQMMRKEQIRNTGLRFRFQMLIQRYNTYQSYWQRITRQIEEGTYKRDLVRAKKKVDQQVRASEAPPSIEVVVSEPPPPPEPATTKMERPAAIKLELDDDFKELEGILREAPKPAAPKVPPAAASKPGVPIPPPSVTIPGTRPVWKKVGEGAPAAPPAPTLILKPPAAPAASRPPPLPPRASAAAPPRPAPPAPVAKPQPAPPAPAPKPAPAAAPKPAPQPAPAAAPKPAPQPAAPPPAAAKKPGDISEDRVRQLYADYVQTKRSQKESTASVTYDALAKTIRESTAKLREKHGGKSVDFEVTVKDGKTILKPVVK